MKFAIAVLFFSSVAWSSVDVNQLNSELRAHGATWTAKETWLSRLNLADQKRLSGPQQEGMDPDCEFVAPDARTHFAGPNKFDWRSVNGVNWVTPVLNQGSCGSCVAFAAIGTLETQWRIASGLSTLPVRLSPQELHSCGGGSCDFGWWPGFAAHYLQTTGVADEACFPYTSGVTGKNGSCQDTCRDAPSRRVRISDFSRPTVLFGNVAKVKRELLKGPLMTLMVTFEDFYAYSSGVYRHLKGRPTGVHAVSIVGFDDAEKAWIFRNSWGEDWGEGGFGKIAYDDISGVGRMTWQLHVPPTTGAVSLDEPVDFQYVTGTLAVKARSTILKTAQLKIEVLDQRAAIAFEGICLAPCERQLDVSHWADGKYEIAVQALDQENQRIGESQREVFYVANQKPTLSLTLSPSHPSDFTKLFKGQIELNVATASSSVPMSSLEFHVESISGKKIVRVAPTVLSNMKIRLNTETLGTGVFDMWAVGRLKTNVFETRIESTHHQIRVQN